MSNFNQGGSPLHPGELIRNELEYRQIPPAHIAEELGVPLPSLLKVLDGKKPITENLAYWIEERLYISSAQLLRMQEDYNRQVGPAVESPFPFDK